MSCSLIPTNARFCLPGAASNGSKACNGSASSPMHTCVKEVGLRRRLTKVRFRTILAAAILTACGGEEVTEKSSSSSTAPTSIAADSGESSRQADHFVFRGAECNVTCAEPAVDQLGAEVELDEADPPI